MIAALLAAPLAAQEDLNLRRPVTPIDAIDPAPPMAPYQETAGRRLRNYPEQPPTIPHSIAGYEISVRANKCLACHSRRRSVETGAPMVSVTHFMDRELQVRSDIAPRRYFCTQCHVPQTTALPPVDNDFRDAALLP